MPRQTRPVHPHLLCNLPEHAIVNLNDGPIALVNLSERLTERLVLFTLDLERRALHQGMPLEGRGAGSAR